eukprot:IDg14737t1
MDTADFAKALYCMYGQCVFRSKGGTSLPEAVYHRKELKISHGTYGNLASAVIVQHTQLHETSNVANTCDSVNDVSVDESPSRAVQRSSVRACGRYYADAACLLFSDKAGQGRQAGGCILYVLKPHTLLIASLYMLMTVVYGRTTNTAGRIKCGGTLPHKCRRMGTDSCDAEGNTL